MISVRSSSANQRGEQSFFEFFSLVAVFVHEIGKKARHKTNSDTKIRKRRQKSRQNAVLGDVGGRTQLRRERRREDALSRGSQSVALLTHERKVSSWAFEENLDVIVRLTFVDHHDFGDESYSSRMRAHQHGRVILFLFKSFLSAGLKRLTFEVEDGLVALTQPVIVECGPVRNVGFDLLVDSIQQPPRDTLWHSSHRQSFEPSCRGRGPSPTERTEKKNKNSPKGPEVRGYSARAARTTCLGSRATSAASVR